MRLTRRIITSGKFSFNFGKFFPNVKTSRKPYVLFMALWIVSIRLTNAVNSQLNIESGKFLSYWKWVSNLLFNRNISESFIENREECMTTDYNGLHFYMNRIVQKISDFHDHHHQCAIDLSTSFISETF